MFDFHEKRKIKAILYSKVVFVLLIFIAVFLSLSVYNRYIIAEETKLKLEERKEDLEALKMRADVLETKVEYLERDRGIEEELRNRFDVAKEGEQVVVILEDEKTRETPSALQESNTPEGEKGMWDTVRQLFKFW